MNIKEILKEANQILIKNNIDESFLKSRILLANVLKVSKEFLITHDDFEIFENQKNSYFELIRRIG